MKNPGPFGWKTAAFSLRIFLSFILGLGGLVLAVATFAPRILPPAESGNTHTRVEEQAPQRFMPVPGGEADDLNRLEEEWNNRLTYPTGVFNPEWVRQAFADDAKIARGVPGGMQTARSSGKDGPLGLDPNAFTALGPQPLRMTGCSSCFNYQFTQGRVNDIAIDPVTTNVAYIATVGGGIWKTTNCCSSTTTWSPTTDHPLIATIATDSVTIDPNDHNTVYAGTGDQNYGSFSMGSQGVLKSTDAGATWTILGADVFGPALPQPAGQFPQYNAVGKVRVDPRNSNNVVAGTKNGLYISNDAGATWTQCATNSFDTMRQDITGLALDDTGGSTRILAAVGVRGFATTVQYNLGQNGANGIYKGTIPAIGCPTDFAPISRNDNGWAGLNPTTGDIYVNPTTGNQVGRIEMAVAPSNPNYIYAQLQSIRPNPNGGCGNAAGCQLGAYRSTDGGTTWTQIPGSTGASLVNCTGGAGDYPQNWFDQAIAVDPNNPDRVFFSTFDVWFWANGNAIWNDTSCGYSGGNTVHVDQHALAFVPGSSSVLLAGNDGGVHGTTNANLATLATDPTWFHMLNGLNTIEFYSGDISGNFANSPNPQVNGGAQDNGSMSVTFSGSPTGPVQWQMGKGGDGFFARIDPVGTGTSLRFWQGNNSGTLNRCINNCTASGATWSTLARPWSADTQSFVLPYEIHKGDLTNPANDCGPAGASTGCGHLVVGTVRVWETITGTASTTGGISWYVNSPANLTKQTLGNRSYINQLAIEPSMQSVVMVGTNDGNVQIGRNMGTGSNQSIWTNLTDNNTVLPNRPILDVAFDPLTTTAPIAYAAVGGFNPNTPATPGHVFQVTCATDCASFTWADKTGNLPDIPVDSIIANPRNRKQIFAGTDWGLYYTDDITVASPVWNRFENGLPHSMIWDMSIDRGGTTLSVWTRGRGAYVWPLPSAPVALTSVVSRKTHGGTGPFDIDLTPPASGIECRSGGANGDYTVVFSFGNDLISVASASVSAGTGSVANSNIGASPNDYIVNLTGVTNIQQLTIQLTNVQDNAGHMSPSVAANMGVLVGDTTGNGAVSSSDVGQVKAQSGNVTNGSNFRADVTADGSINSSDIGFVKSLSGTALP